MACLPKQALEHPYLRQFHEPANERVASFTVKPLIDDDEKKSTEVYRERLYHEITKLKRKYKQKQEGKLAGSHGVKHTSDSGLSQHARTQSRHIR
jgi:mitogen-activated protein kinase 15